MTMNLSGQSGRQSPLFDIPTRSFLLGLPALFGAIAVVVCAITIGRTSQADRIMVYHNEARRSLHAGELDRSQECYERLLAARPDDLRFQYEYALLQLAQGHRERAYVILQRLSPDNGVGFAPAHVWQARQYLARADSASSPEALKSAASHLQAAISSEPEHAIAHALLGKVYMAAGRSDLAIRHLQLSVDQIPQARLELARAHRANGDQTLAEEQAWLAIEFFRRRVATRRNDGTARLGWAEAALVLDDYVGAVGLLRAGLDLTKQPVYRQRLGEVYADWGQKLATDPAVDSQILLATVLEGLQYTPLSTSLLMHLVELSQADGAVAEQAQAQVARSLAASDSMPTMHMLLGMRAQQRGEDRVAREHYEQAYAAAPQMAIVGNNLAWLLAHSDPVDLPRALEIIDTVIQQWPTQLDFHDTRGQILAKLGRQEESIAELNFVAAGRSGHRRLEDTMAELFR